MTVEIKLLSSDEARDEATVGELVQLVNGAYAVGEAGLWREGATRTSPAEMAEAIRSGGMLAATADGGIVGCADVRPLDADTADLGLVSAAPERWGSGIGRELVRSAEELMRARGLTTMQLELLVPTEGVHREKERLRAWYTRLGYRVVRTAPFEQVAPHLAAQLATKCEFLIFHKPLPGRAARPLDYAAPVEGSEDMGMPGIDPTVPPSGTGCAECMAGMGAGWWFHLRRCAQCGHVGCCDSSPSQHSRAHWHETEHPVVQSFEPGESWFWLWPEDTFVEGLPLAPPTSHPPDQPVPGPAGRVPSDWMARLNS